MLSLNLISLATVLNLKEKLSSHFLSKLLVLVAHQALRLMEFYLSSLQLTWLLRNECAGLLSHQTGCKGAPNWGKRA